MAAAEIDQLEEIVAEVSERLEGTHHPLIMVDGFDGSGKTSLSVRLSGSLGAKVIHLDNFLTPNQNVYLSALNIQEINREVGIADVEGAPVIVEGVCVGLVLLTVGRKPDLRIYCKKLGPGSYWNEGAILDEFGNSKDALVKEEWRAREFSALDGEPFAEDEDPLGGLFREKIKYHFDFRPHETADIVYIWREGDDAG